MTTHVGTHIEADSHAEVGSCPHQSGHASRLRAPSFFSGFFHLVSGSHAEVGSCPHQSGHASRLRVTQICPGGAHARIGRGHFVPLPRARPPRLLSRRGVQSAQISFSSYVGKTMFAHICTPLLLKAVAPSPTDRGRFFIGYRGPWCAGGAHARIGRGHFVPLPRARPPRLQSHGQAIPFCSPTATGAGCPL